MTGIENSNWDKTQELKLYKTKKNQIVTQLKNSNYDQTKEKSNCVKTQKLIGAVVIVTVVTVAVVTEVIVAPFSKNNLTP